MSFPLHPTVSRSPVRCRFLAFVILGAVAAGCQSDAPSPESESEKPQQASWDRQRPEFLELAERLEGTDDRYFGQQSLTELRQEASRADLTAEGAIRARVELSQDLLRLGKTDEAIEQIELAVIAAVKFGRLSPDKQYALHEARMLCYLREAENRNCIAKHNKDCCLFPLQGQGVHSLKSPAEKARESLYVLLQLKPQELSAAWLLNVVSMAIGDHPEAVPEPYRIPPSAFESEYPVPRFVDVAPELGMNTFNLCGGAITEDFDGDGNLDIVTSTFDPRGALSYYRNLGTGKFEDASQASRLDDQLGGLNCIGADYDGDGDTDILVLRGAWMYDHGQIRNSLLRNEGDGTFKDVTRETGLAEPGRPTQAAVWGDFDNDGDLDLYVANESRLEFESNDGNYPAQLFRNNGDGTFRDIASPAGVANNRYAKGVTAGDFDNDGDLDLYVSNIGPNRLYQNEGNGIFRDVAKRAGVAEPVDRSFATWFFDYDNDGFLDLFVAAYDAQIADLAADYLHRPHTATFPRLYRNRGDGTFEDVAESAGLAHPYLPMGANFGDIDNDGFLDIYLTTGAPSFGALMPNVMLRNNAGKSFQDVTTAAGLGHLQKGHGIAFADLDHDGDQDIYHQLGGFFPGDAFHNALFLNPGIPGHHFVVIKLRGTTSNRSAIGARLRVVVQGDDRSRTFHRAVGSVSSFGGSPIRQEIGLGPAERIERIEIDWPRTGETQVIEGVPLDSRIEIVEGTPGFQQLPFGRTEFLPSQTNGSKSK